jgi:hypothetical protein
MSSYRFEQRPCRCETGAPRKQATRTLFPSVVTPQILRTDGRCRTSQGAPLHPLRPSRSFWIGFFVRGITTINLITRSAEGTLRAVKNLYIGSFIEAVRDRTKTIDFKQVNAVLLHPP